MSTPRQLRQCDGCGAQWFRLREAETATGFVDGTVCVGEEGDIVHYSGMFECARCGAVLDADGPAERRDGLRVVR